MDNLESGLQSILGNPQMMEQIMSLAQNLQSEPSPPPPPAEGMPELDMALFTNKKSKSTPETSKAALEYIKPILEGITDWSETTLHNVVMEAIPATGMKNATVLWPLRIAVTGRAATPGGAFEMLYLLGKDESMKRLDAAMAKL